LQKNTTEFSGTFTWILQNIYLGFARCGFPLERRSAGWVAARASLPLVGGAGQRLVGGAGQRLVGQPGWAAQVETEAGAQLSQLGEHQLSERYIFTSTFMFNYNGLLNLLVRYRCLLFSAYNGIPPTLPRVIQDCHVKLIS